MFAGRGLWVVAALILSSACGAPKSSAKACALARTGTVVDQANILSQATKASLVKQLADLKALSSDELIVATTASLNNEDIEFYSVDLARCWKIGPGKAQNGLMVLIAPNERKARIEVGWGLENSVKDEEAKAIMDTAIIPNFKKGDYDAGIEAGVSALILELTKDRAAVSARAAINAQGRGQ